VSVTQRALRLVFDLDAAIRAFEEWGCNCGPGALAAIGGVSLDTAREWLGRDEFDRKRYTNPTMMLAALQRSGLAFKSLRQAEWPQHGLVRVQWEGPWTAPGANPRWAYRQTHWIGSSGGLVFDINCMCAGGWVDRIEWRDEVVPWLLKTAVPRADGKWHLTHAIEVDACR